jgi:L-asparagine transporter-like permease
VLATGLALLLQVVLIPWFEVEPDASPFMMFFAAVMVAAYVGGLGPGLLATVLSALASHYFSSIRSMCFGSTVLGRACV